MTNDVNSPDKWTADYQRGTDGWDLGGPTPVFRRLLQDWRASGEFPPGRLLVPGAGRGHDAREFARHGFQVTAVDFSPYAVAEMRRLAVPDAPIEILHQDFFALGAEWNGVFDYVLQYTCFCAIDPARRTEYADVVARALKPGGILIDLAFPLNHRTGGPPFSVSVQEIIDLFGARGLYLLRRKVPAESVKPRRGLEELLLLKKGERET